MNILCIILCSLGADAGWGKIYNEYLGKKKELKRGKLSYSLKHGGSREMTEMHNLYVNI